MGSCKYLAWSSFGNDMIPGVLGSLRIEFLMLLFPARTSMIIGTYGRSQFATMLYTSCLEPRFAREGLIGELVNGQMDKTSPWESHKYCVCYLLFSRMRGRRSISVLHCAFRLYSYGTGAGTCTCSDALHLFV